MTSNHPILPSSEQVKQWTEDWYNTKIKHDDIIGFVADQAAKWASDKELNACCRWIVNRKEPFDELDLHNARRPKPPSLKEQALAELDLLKADAIAHGLGFDASAIRKALEQLSD
jgi:hypothetical protein